MSRLVALAALVMVSVSVSPASAGLEIAGERPPPPPPPPRAKASDPPTIAVAIEDTVGVIKIGGESHFAGGFAARRFRERGRTSLIVDASIWLLGLMPPEEERELRESGGLMLRIGGAVKRSLWKPSGRTLSGDFWLEGGAGYRIGTTNELGTFHELDLNAGAGMGYDITEADKDSDAKAFSAYVVLRGVAPAKDPSQLGLLFSVGMKWTR